MFLVIILQQVIKQMSRTFASSLNRANLQQKNQTYYIVKEDFITNLRKGRRYRARTEPVEQRQPTFILESCAMVDKKSEIQRKLPFRSNNDFCELDKQIQNNSRSLYRKMTVAMKREKQCFQVKLDNPFAKVGSSSKSMKNSFNQEKKLADLVYYVQPYWIKKYISKTPQNAKHL